MPVTSKKQIGFPQKHHPQNPNLTEPASNRTLRN
jgi:hypothetical protein